ncbi:MAG: ShlB/FhaC/HecB family hemolysin secretion/activation protein [Phormidesmis sp.]
MKVGLAQSIAVISILGSGAVSSRPAIAADSQLEESLLNLAADSTALETTMPERTDSNSAALDIPVLETRDTVAIDVEVAAESEKHRRLNQEVTLLDLLPQENSPTRRTDLLGETAVDVIDSNAAPTSVVSEIISGTSAESGSLQLPASPLKTSPLLSQNTPAGELSEPEETLEPLAEPAQVLPESVAPEPDPGVPTNTTKVLISDIQVVGSTVFSAQDFEPVVSPYEGQDLGLRELRQVADDVTRLYLESGYITSRAVLSEQSIVDGVVQIRAVEGSLEAIQVEGTRRLADYVRDRVNLANKTPLNQSALESQLQLLRADPLVDRIEASLRAGTGEGQSLLIVRVLASPLFSGRAVFDTNSPPSVGVGRMGVETTFNSPLGLGDRLSASAFRSTAGGSTAYNFGYSVPLNAMDGTLQARYSPSTFALIDPELQALGVRGSSDTYELTYRQPLIRKPNKEFALSLGFRHRTGETLVSDVVIDSTRTSVFQFEQDYLKRDRKGAWGLRSQFNLGTGLLEATNRADGEADGQFFSWLGQVQRAQVINRDNLLLIQGSFQASPDSLLGADQFIIGGATSVRGYSQNARFGDNGFRASVENRTTVLRNEDGSPATQIAPFLDTAAVWNNRGNTSEQRWLLGTGVGVITNLVENVQARLDVGIPLIKVNESGDSDQSAFIYFSIDYRF